MQAITIGNLKELEQLKTLQISIVSPESKEEASQYLIKIDKASKQLTLDIKALKAPHKAEIDRIDAAAKPWQQILVERKDAIGRAILQYNNKLAEAVRLANQKALEKYEVKVEKQESKAIAQGKPIPVVLPPVLATAPPKTETVEGGKLTTVKRKAWRLPAIEDGDPSELTALTAQVKGLGIPLDFFILDTARIGKIVRAGGSVPGILVYEEESLSVRA
jgi:hypothetical protein